MNHRTILVHCDTSSKLPQRLEVAVELAQRFGAHLAGIHVQVPIDIPTLSTGVIPPVDFYAAYEAVAKAQHDAAAATFEKAVKGSHLPTEWRLAKSYHEDENASRESARAAAEALPFLVMADKVIVLIVDTTKSGSGYGPEPGAAISAWLARHGVRVTVQRDVAADTDVGNVIMSRAAANSVDLIVMGLYGHSRLREVILGGASRTLLSNMTVPILMAH
jgi:nucleotide-binding universal stress UspA family protein